MMPIGNYRLVFAAHVRVRLGGLEMSDEFYTMHPNFKSLMCAATTMHYAKGGAAHKGAAIFYQRVIMPQLQLDREASRGIDHYLDPRN